MLSYNDSRTLEKSILSILPLSNYKDIEIVVVDNKSNDGSGEILSGYQKKRMIKYISRKCSRGLGRQLAFENSQGDYILACMDCDDEFIAENLLRLINMYHEKYEGLVMMTKKTKKGEEEASNITIAPRLVVNEIGGWRDINWCEDWDFWARAEAVGKYTFMRYPYSYPPHKLITVRVRRRSNLIAKLLARYGKYKDAFRIGRPPFAYDESVSMSQRIVYFIAKVVVVLRGNRLTKVQNPLFEDAVYSE